MVVSNDDLKQSLDGRNDLTVNNTDNISPNLNEQITNFINQLRPGQKELALWRKGKMAVSAVPGAGKSHSLAIASAITIAREGLNHHKQLVIVTYTRSATASIKKKIQDRLKDLSLPPIGFTVQTIHGLALNIANRHPYLSELNLETSTLVELNAGSNLIKETVANWVATQPDYFDLLIRGEKKFDYEESEVLRRRSVLLTEVVPNVAYEVISIAKSSRLSIVDLKNFSLSSDKDYPLMTIASGLYEQYEQLMKARNLIDYDDLILGALKVLDNEDIRKIWQSEVFAVFEDEAQDSSLLQGELLEILASKEGQSEPNLVRVGDPNQAINSTFTAADPIYFQSFCQECEQKQKLQAMTQAGRSNEIIIQTANQALTWINEEIARQLAINPPFKKQFIEPVSETDTQPNANPPAEGKGLEIYTPNDIYQTIKLIGERIIALHSYNPQSTWAILVRENRQGTFAYQYLEHLQLEHNINLKLVNDAHNYRHIPQEILSLLQFIYCPHSPQYLKNALQTLQEKDLITAQDINALSVYPEKFLYPDILEEEQKPHVKQAKDYCLKLINARFELPSYQLISFLSFLLEYQQSELATAQKLSERIQKQINGQYSLKNMIDTLQQIIAGEKFEGIDTENEESYMLAGQVTIMTMHKAKGLEWDYVFLPFLHEDVLPGDGEAYVPKSRIFLGKFNLSDVIRTQIRHALHQQYQQSDSNIKDLKLLSASSAWLKANQDKQAEEYRLLYVAITRAKKLLWMSAAKKAPWRWSFFADYKNKSLIKDNKQPCPVLTMLSC